MEETQPAEAAGPLEQETKTQSVASMSIMSSLIEAQIAEARSAQMAEAKAQWILPDEMDTAKEEKDEVFWEEIMPHEKTGASFMDEKPCPQQKCLIKALCSQLHLLADVMDALGEHKPNQRQTVEFVHSLEEATKLIAKGASIDRVPTKEKDHFGVPASKAPDIFGIPSSRETRLYMYSEHRSNVQPPKVSEMPFMTAEPGRKTVTAEPGRKTVIHPSIQPVGDHSPPVLAHLVSPDGDADPPHKSAKSNEGELTWEEKQHKKHLERSQSFVSVQPEGWRSNIRAAMKSGWFEPIFAIIIVINSITIGIDTEMRREGDERTLVLDVFTGCFFVIYSVEFPARLLAFGFDTLWKNHWVQFDALLLTTMYIDTIVTMVGSTDATSMLNVFRLFRIARLARVLRPLGESFKTLWMFVQGLFGSVQTLSWIFVVIGIILYIFAVLGMEVVQFDPNASAEYNDVVDVYFGDLAKTMLTMVLLGLCLDDIGVIYRSLLLEKPILVLYFMALLMVVSIATLNMCLTLMVESSLAQAASDELAQKAAELEQKRQTLEELAKAFRQLDADGSGNVSREELHSCPPEVLDYMCKVIGNDDPDEIINIFDMLDYNNSDELTIEEFCEGMNKIISGEPVELHCLLKQCKDIRMFVEGVKAAGS